MFSGNVTETRSPALPRRLGALGLLGLVWAVSLVVVATPLADTTLLKALFLSVPVSLSALVTVGQPRVGFTVWTFGLLLLVTQTGFQLDVGPVRTSALEVATVFLLLALLFVRRRQNWLPDLHLPGQKIFALFAAYAVVMLIITLILGTSPGLALFQFKGFLLYPLMSLVFVAGLSSPRALRWLVIILLAWYLYWATRGVLQFVQGATGTGLLSRASGGYAPINLYGVTLTTMALFLIGFGEHVRRSALRVLAHVLALALFVAAVTSLSRTIWVAFLAGLLALMVLRQIGARTLLLWIVLVAAVTVILVPPEALNLRVLQFVDSSTEQRNFYLLSGWQAWKARFLSGWGWGRAFSYVEAGLGRRITWSQLLAAAGEGELVPTNSIPWYHNDYLNLAVQTGLIGLGLYLAFWQRVLAAGRRWLAGYRGSWARPYVVGSLAALVGLLVSALFDHVLWRPDVAGLVGLFLGILLAAMRLGQRAGDET